MPYPIASGSIVEVTAEGRHNGQVVMNVWHYYMEKIGGITDGAAALAQLLASLEAAGEFFDLYLDCLSEDVDDINLYAQWITPARFRYVVGLTGPRSGAVLESALPQNVQASITLFGEEANRHNIGRKAMPGVPNTFVLNGLLTAAALPAYTSLINATLTPYVGLEGEDYTPVIFNRVTPELSPIIIGGFVQDTARVERRRTVGVGA